MALDPTAPAKAPKAPRKPRVAKAPAAKATAKPAAKAAVKPRISSTAKPSAAKANVAKSRVTKPKPIPTEATLRDHATGLAGQAKGKARDAAKQGLVKTGDVLDNFAATFAESAKLLEKRYGKQAGDYARKASDAVSNAASSVKGQEVDDLFESARGLVKKKPLIAAGVAAAIGFGLMRLLRAGDDDKKS